MCKPLGVDPLSAENGFWGSKLGIGEFCYSMLGIGEFYYELSVKVAEICLASRSRNGGIMR
jgi:ESCRT-II complex subunit VPS22